jgi:hypothetical protein
MTEQVLELFDIANEKCAHCRKPDCEYCNAYMKCAHGGECGDNCNCLCVLQRPNNKLGEVNIMASDFKIGCGDVVLRKVIGELREMQEVMIKERIAYKAMKQKQDALITKQGVLIDSMKKALLMRGITI